MCLHSLPQPTPDRAAWTESESEHGHKDTSAVPEGPLGLDEGLVCSSAITTMDGSKCYTGSGQRVIVGDRRQGHRPRLAREPGEV